MHRAAFVIVLLALHAAASASELVHPFPPGGPAEVIGAMRASRALRAMQRYAAPAFTDILAMHVGQTLTAAFDERVDVIRRHRRGGAEAYVSVSNAAPDGRTLLLDVVPATVARMKIEPALTPVAVVASMPYAWVARGDIYARTLPELLRGGSTRLLTAHPGQRTVAYAPLARLRAMPAFAVEPIAYNGGVAALNAVASSQVAAALVPLPAVLPYAGSERIRLLAIADVQRHASVPLVPTSAEQGLEHAEAIVRFSVFAPAATPPAARRAVVAALARVAEADAARELFAGFGLRLEYREASVR